MSGNERISPHLWLHISMILSRKTEILSALAKAGNHAAEDALRPSFDLLIDEMRHADPFPLIKKVEIETPDDSPVGW